MSRSLLLCGDASDKLRGLPAESVHACVTSPPYFGLRDYGTATWSGGDAECDHVNGTDRNDSGKREGLMTGGPMPGGVRYYRNTCGKCGATRQDRQLGLESTPEEYVARMVEVFREVRRVLRDDGVLWLNIGDTYNAYNGNRGTDSPYAGDRGVKEPLPPGGSGLHAKGLKQKDLVGIPWRVAFALQADGWYLRCDVIWAKPNPMPESVTDRPTKAHEYVFLMTKAARYFWDARTVAAREVSAGQPGNGTRNLRTVWTIATAPYAGAHFAAFPPEFVRRCIRAGCPYDGVVLDPFMGSGTTGAVAAQMRRRFIGIDLNPEYVEMAKARIRDARAKYLFRAPAQ